MARLDSKTYIQHSRTILREWLPYLTASESVVVLFIFDRTVGWSKDFEKIPLGHFINGVEGYSAGTGLSRSTVIRALAALEEDKVIELDRKDDQSNRYSINLDTGIMLRKSRKEASEEATPKLKTPRKKTSNQCQIDTGGSVKLKPDQCQNETRGGVKLSTITDQKNKRSKKQIKSVPSFHSASEALEEVNSSHKARREQARERAKGKFATNADLESVWREACCTNFEGMRVFPWGGKERGMIATLRKKWKAGGGDFPDFIDFLEWCVEWWPDVMRGKFGWMKNNPPSTPDLAFFVRNVQDWLSAFGNGEPYKAPAKKVTRKERVAIKRDSEKLKKVRAELAEAEERKAEKEREELRAGMAEQAEERLKKYARKKTSRQPGKKSAKKAARREWRD